LQQEEREKRKKTDKNRKWIFAGVEWSVQKYMATRILTGSNSGITSQKLSRE
jgi:hypothetical protein